MKKIYINGRFLTQSITGVQRYATELVRSLDQLLESGYIDRNKYNIEIIAPKNIKHELNLKNIQCKQKGVTKGHIWEQLELPFYSKDGLLFNLCNLAPFFRKHQIVTIHDAAVFANYKNFSLKFRLWYKFLYLSFPTRLDRIITVSDFSEKELLKHKVTSNKKIVRIYEGKEHIFRIENDDNIISKYKLNERPFFLAVSSLNPNKNFKSIVEAIMQLGSYDYNIVIAGGTNPRVFSDSNLDLPKNVIHLGYVSDEELKALYNNAFCFIYPSFYEGFGLPPLEAMACGCPVIVSDAASLPEVCENAAIYCNPYNPKDISDKIKYLIKNPSLREELKRKGLVQSQKFNWEHTAKETFKVIEEVVSK